MVVMVAFLGSEFSQRRSDGAERLTHLYITSSYAMRHACEALDGLCWIREQIQIRTDWKLKEG